MPHKEDMIFIQKKDIQPQPSSVANKVDEQEVDREEVDTTLGVAEWEVGLRRVKQSKIDWKNTNHTRKGAEYCEGLGFESFLN